MRRRFFLIAITLVEISLFGCASTDPLRARHAEELKQQGEFAAALVHSEALILDRRSVLATDDIERHVEILRGLNRNVEAEAFEEFSLRYLSGRATQRTGLGQRLRQCIDTQKRRRRSGELIHLSQRPLGSRGTVVAVRYAVGADGQLTKIRLLQARNPAVAWSVIDRLASARVVEGRLSKLADDEFPVEHCRFWPGVEIEAGSWRAPRVRNNW